MQRYNIIICLVSNCFMKKIFLAILIAFTLNCSVDAQKTAKAAYAELGGPGLASINYDMRFKKQEGGFGFRVGVGGFSIDNQGLLIIPVGLNYITSKDNKNYFEVGGGVSYIHAGKDFLFNDKAFTSTFGFLTIGYRSAPIRGGFFFKASIDPVFGKGYFYPYYGGIGFGYKF